MGFSKEIFVDLQEKFEKVKKLIDEDSKLDPPDEPYKSKYAAKDILNDMKKILEKLQENNFPEIKDLVNMMLGTVWFHLGIVSMGTEELSAAEKEFNSALKFVENEPLNKQYVLIILNTLNQLGIYWSCKDFEKSKEFLTQSQKLYINFKDTNQTPLSFLDIFNASGDRNEPEAKKLLETTHTLTLYYLAQVYGALKFTLKSAIYCHITLKRELEFDDFDPIDWALNSATLAQVLMEQNGFKQARHHLAAASYILGVYEKKLNLTSEISEENDAKIEIFKHRSADIARCWAKYGLLLLMTSRDRLLNHTDDENEVCQMCTDLSKIDITPDSKITKEDISNITFTSIELQTYEDQITDQFILTFEDARAIFLPTQNWLNDAMNYYTLENHASDHVQIIQDVSQVYNNLAFFEDDSERQAKMHKRRIDILEKVLNELNPTYYMQVCRQLWFELGETYNTILDIKMDKLKTQKEKPTPHAIIKVNNLLEKSIEHFCNFINSLKAPLTDQMPEKIPDEYEKATIKAYFQVGVLYGKYLNPDKKVQVEYTSISLEYFNKMVDYCDKHPNTRDYSPVELSVCREMATLLPFKIQKLKNAALQQA